MAKVLIAEDDHLMRWSLETALGRHGHTVHSVGSGDDAIAAVMTGDYHAVVTDYALPNADGLQVLLRTKMRRPQTHVIVITGDPTPELEKRARDMGAFEFLEKPFPLPVVAQAVERALATPERRKGPRGCCGQCAWQQPCARWEMEQSARVT